MWSVEKLWHRYTRHQLEIAEMDSNEPAAKDLDLTQSLPDTFDLNIKGDRRRSS